MVKKFNSTKEHIIKYKPPIPVQKKHSNIFLGKMEKLIIIAMNIFLLLNFFLIMTALCKGGKLFTYVFTDIY